MLLNSTLLCIWRNIKRLWYLNWFLTSTTWIKIIGQFLLLWWQLHYRIDNVQCMIEKIIFIFEFWISSSYFHIRSREDELVNDDVSSIEDDRWLLSRHTESKINSDLMSQLWTDLTELDILSWCCWLGIFCEFNFAGNAKYFMPLLLNTVEFSLHHFYFLLHFAG